MSKKMIFLMALFAWIISLNLAAQTIVPNTRLLLNLDYARFLYDDQTGYLEIYYGFHPKHFTFNYLDGKYNGGVMIATKIRNKDTNEFVVNQTSCVQLSETDTSGVWYRFPFISQVGYSIPNGSYSLEVMASDSLAPSRCDSLTLDVNIKSFGSDLAVSDIELCKKITSSSNKDDLFYKNSLEVVPYPLLIFGVTTAPVVFYYVELYNLNTDVTYNVRTEILDANGALVRETTKQRKYKAKNFPEVGSSTVTSYQSGKYTFRFALLDEKQHKLVSTEKLFYILNQHLHAAQQITGADKEQIESISDKEMSEEFRFTNYLATDEENKLFKELKSGDAKRQFLYEFWSKIARGRRDFPPVNRTEYLERTKIANERYGSFSKKGWKSDRGRVFMIYSEPDEVERAPHQADTKPYEIWRYYEIENGVEFVFVDRRGFGELELVHSTKRGEFSDETWKRYLR